MESLRTKPEEKIALLENLAGELANQYVSNVLIAWQNPAARSQLIEQNKQVGEALGKTYLGLAVMQKSAYYYMASQDFYQPDDLSQIVIGSYPLSEDFNFVEGENVDLKVDPMKEDYESILQHMGDLMMLGDKYSPRIWKIFNDISPVDILKTQQDALASKKILEKQIANYPTVPK